MNTDKNFSDALGNGFMSYYDGVYMDPSCTTTSNHGVVSKTQTFMPIEKHKWIFYSSSLAMELILKATTG